ncbi:hypothetical protein [Haloplanus natans]|uniref:hypothetical protein n=1 Tax=Haloplanus natans TaxID=376171 RepID=UPI000677BDB4|nr:hypothetical protein [Haloplanus natans]
MANPLPDAVQELLQYSETLIAFAKAPARFIRKRVLSFIVGVVAALVSATGSIGRGAFEAVADAFRAASEPFMGAVGGVIFPIIDTWVGLNVGVANVATGVLGPAAPIAVVAFIVFQLALVIRAIPPLLVAASDLLGAVPVIGSILDALATFAIEYIGGSRDQ